MFLVEQFTPIESDSDSNDDIDEDDNDDGRNLYLPYSQKYLYWQHFSLGQETPADEKLPLEVLSKFNGKTREVYNLQHIKTS